MRRASALLASLATAAALGGASASAQTLTSPDSRPTPSLPAPAKSQAQDRVKTCGAYGAGFVALPGTDACVKIGGSVTTDVSGTGH